MDNAALASNFPAELRALPRWVAWKREERNGKATKVPYRPDGRHAAVNRPGEWSSFADVLAAADRFDGIGFVFTEGYVGIDVDKCLLPDGSVTEEAMEVLMEVDSYTERSPSGTGLHVIVRSREGLPGRKKGGLECYSTGRFFTVTGDVYGGRSELRDADLSAWHAQAFGGGETPVVSPTAPRPEGLPDDAEILSVMFRSKGGSGLADLYVTGDYAKAGYSSQSEADLALCGSLMFFCGNDAATADRLFRSSKLMRDKWDGKRGKRTYGEQTLDRARKAEVMPWGRKERIVAAAKEAVRTGGGFDAYIVEAWKIWPQAPLRETDALWYRAFAELALGK